VIDRLHELSRIANAPRQEAADVQRACGVLRDVLSAEDVYVLRAGDPHYVRLGCPCDPTRYEIKQKGYWLVWRAAATTPGLSAGMFDVSERLVGQVTPLRPGKPTTHLGAILPGDESNSELLIARGPWPDGLSEEQAVALETARPILAYIVSSALDAERRTRQREQLEALANVSRAFNEARETDNVLTALATALAKASGFDWVIVLTFDEDGERVVERAINVARYSATSTAALARDGFGTDDATAEARLGGELAAHGPLLIRDVFDSKLAERDQAAPIRATVPFLQKYWERAHILSLGMFPIVFQGRPLGLIYFSSATQRAFDELEVEFLTALTAQAATAIKGLRLYRDLQDSREELRQSEERFRSLVQNSSDIITVVDETGMLRYASPAVERLMGYRAEDWTGTSILSMVHPDDVERAAASLAAVAREPGVHPPTVIRVLHRDGSWRYIETTANNLLDVPSVGGIVHNSHDITERWQAEQAVRQSEERFRSLVQNASDLITVIDTDTTVIYQSPSIRRMLGYAAERLVGGKLIDLIHAEDAARVIATIGDVMSKPDAVVRGETRIRHEDGSWRHIEFSCTDQRRNAAIGGIVLNTHDVTERKLLEEQLRHQALHDPLTKLANRTRFTDRLEHALLRAGRTGHQVAVLFMDLDNFKSVNDSLGHSAGDYLLTEVAERVQTCLRPFDTIARLGGDEFAILLEDVTSIDDATGVTERIFQVLGTPFELEGKELIVRASIGIALGEGGAREAGAEGLLRDADVAMYVAKSHGKGRCEVFEQSMQATMLERLALLSDLQRALEREEFFIHYQPMVLLKSGRLIGLEALVRWQHPSRGVLPPSQFIALAEESGAILELGKWVLRRACEQAVAWQARYPSDPPWTMSVNVSVKQLQHHAFVEDVAEVLRETGIEPHTLILEITESVMMQDVSRTLGLLAEIKALGVRLAIDDFGTGYSSLSYLRQFPFDLLKIDKSFIDDVGMIMQQKELTRAIIELGKTLDMELVAEGIERREQLTRLQSMECELGQGFYFAEPLAPDAVPELLGELTGRSDAA